MLKIIIIQEASGSPYCRNLKYPDGEGTTQDVLESFVLLAVLKEDPPGHCWHRSSGTLLEAIHSHINVYRLYVPFYLPPWVPVLSSWRTLALTQSGVPPHLG